MRPIFNLTYHSNMTTSKNFLILIASITAITALIALFRHDVVALCKLAFAQKHEIGSSGITENDTVISIGKIGPETPAHSELIDNRNEPDVSAPSDSAPIAIVDSPTSVRSLSVPTVKPAQMPPTKTNAAQSEASLRGMGYDSALRHVAKLGDSLSENQIADLYKFLKIPLHEFAGIDAPKVASLKNQVMDKLLEQRTLPADYAAEMSALYRDRSNDELLRNFAVQHLDLYAGALDVRGGYDAASPVAAQMRATLATASHETSSSIGGTALLCLERLSQLDPNIDRAAVASQAAQYAANASTHIQSRIAAVQLCGKMRVLSSAATLRAIVNDSASNTALRLAAQNALNIQSNQGQTPK